MNELQAIFISSLLLKLHHIISYLLLGKPSKSVESSSPTNIPQTFLANPSLPNPTLSYTSPSSSSSSYIFHGVGPLVDPFRSHVSRSLFKGLPFLFCQLGSSVSLPWVICFEAFYLHVVSSFCCIPVIIVGPDTKLKQTKFIGPCIILIVE